VRAELHRVDEEGRELGTVARIHRRLGQVEDLDLLQFSFPATLGFYRIDVAFESLRGRKLASYEEYFRVIPRRVKLRVAVSKPVFDRGEIAYARVLNLGTVAAELRPGLLVERKEDGKWIREAKPPVSAKSIKQFRWTLFGGRASPCVAFSIPADTPPGALRFTASALVFGKFHRRELTAPFAVRALAASGSG
jgi:hypothetical protein